jgi:hypothetical protein
MTVDRRLSGNIIAYLGLNRIRLLPKKRSIPRFNLRTRVSSKSFGTFYAL